MNNLSFHAESGDTVGIVGPTGSGKSTILKLLFRFYDPTSGTITVDDTDIREFSKHSYRSAIGYVSQDPYLFAGTVAENISYGAPDTTTDKIVEAAKQAKAHEFIEDLDDGYETDVGEGGNRISGGQRQRIALARAVVGDPEIMILDEATSDVDNRTKVLIQQSLREVTANRTTFVVAHNISTVRFADHILTIEKGELKEEGTHESLVTQDGLYTDLWRLQTGDLEGLSDDDELQAALAQD
ncbi:ABC transporter ATP-binding protein [Halogeometricum borinquense]|nr:ATP-binding cassette domain-containing protein [Halogeometricum borinquense]